MVKLQPPSKSAVIYSDSDGKPIADNTKQFRWIVVIQQNLEWLFAANSDFAPISIRVAKGTKIWKKGRQK